MSNTEEPAAPLRDTASVAGQMKPEGRLAADQSAAPAFADATSPGEETKSSEASVEAGDRERFEEIAAQCRYCGRSLEPDTSL